MFQRSWTPTAVACAALLAATIHFPISSLGSPELPNYIILEDLADRWVEQSTGNGLVVMTEISDWQASAHSSASKLIGLEIIFQGLEVETYLPKPGFGYSATILRVTKSDVRAWSVPPIVGDPSASQWESTSMKPAEEQPQALSHSDALPTRVTGLSFHPGPEVIPCIRLAKLKGTTKWFPRHQAEVFFLSEYSQIKWDNKDRLFQNCMSAQVGSAEFTPSVIAWWPPCWTIGNNAFLRSSGFSGWGCVVFAKRRDGLGSQSTSTST